MSEASQVSEVSPKLPKEEIERIWRELKLDLVSGLVRTPEFQEALMKKFLPHGHPSIYDNYDSSLYDYIFTKDGQVFRFSAGIAASGVHREFESFYIQIGDRKKGDLFWLGEPFDKNFYNRQYFTIGTRVGGDTQTDNQIAVDRFRDLITRFTPKPKI